MSCFSHASLLRTNPDSFVATGLGCEYGHCGRAQSTPCLQLESCVGFVGSTTGAAAAAEGAAGACGPCGRGPAPRKPPGRNAGAFGLKTPPGPPATRGGGPNADGGVFQTFCIAAKAWACIAALAWAWAITCGGNRLESGWAAKAGNGMLARTEGCAPPCRIELTAVVI